MAVASALARQRRILVVDDVEVNRTLTAAILRSASYDVDSVGDGAAAIAAAAGKDYDLVLMDIDMLGIDGHQAAAAIRQDNNRGKVPVAAFTVLNGIEARARSRELGLAAHIARPIGPRALLREIDKACCPRPAAERPDPWQRDLYEDLVVRLGPEKMHGFLVRLGGQLRNLLAMFAGDAEDAAIRHAAHDAASVAGMFGFMDLTRHCRQFLGSPDAAAQATLVDALERAITRLDEHVMTRDRVGAERSPSAGDRAEPGLKHGHDHGRQSCGEG